MRRNRLNQYHAVMQRPVEPRDLPDDLALPLASGAQWWYWLGGRPAIDFVNTLRERWRRRVETLVTPDELGLWLVRAGLLPTAPRVTRPDLRGAIDLCVQAALGGHAAPRAAVTTIDGWLTDAGGRAHLALAGDGTPVLGEREPADPVR